MTINEAIEILTSDPEGTETPDAVWQEAVEKYNFAIYEGGPLCDDSRTTLNADFAS